MNSKETNVKNFLLELNIKPRFARNNGKVGGAITFIFSDGDDDNVEKGLTWIPEDDQDAIITLFNFEADGFFEDFIIPIFNRYQGTFVTDYSYLGVYITTKPVFEMNQDLDQVLEDYTRDIGLENIIARRITEYIEMTKEYELEE